jgi:galactose mutarotase-like enzyme
MSHRNGVTKLTWLCIGIASLSALTNAQQTVFSKPGYSITQTTNAGGWVYTLIDSAAKSKIEVWQKGGCLNRFNATVNALEYEILLAGGNNWKMMPWPNRTAGGKFTADGVTYDLLNPLITSPNENGTNAIHGVVKDKMYTKDTLGMDSLGLYFRCFYDTEKETTINNVFDRFKDFSVYRLKGNTCIVEGYFQNLSNKVFTNGGWGWHPQFNAPFKPVGANNPQKSSKDKCVFKMPATKVALVTNMIPTSYVDVGTYESGKFDFRAGKAFANLFIEHYYSDLTPEPDLVDAQGTKYVRMALIDNGNKVRVQFFGEYPVQPFITLHTTTTEPFLNPEYQTMDINGLNTRKYLMSVPANQYSPRGRYLIVADGDTALKR